jgi:serpin B
MQKLYFIGIFIILILSIASCVSEPSDPSGMHKIRPLTYEEEVLLNSSNEFSFELLRMLEKSHSDENILFSSLGVGNGIGMSLNILEIKPKEELKNFLNISNVRDIEINKAYFELGRMLNYMDLDVRFVNGNSIWINHTQDFNPYSSDKIMAYYDADINYLNFNNPKNTRRINQWAENRTYGEIHSVIDTIIPSDKSYIVNLLYFDISKALPFEQIHAEKFMFNTINGDRIDCDGLKLVNGSYKKLMHSEFDLIDIPLGKGQFYLTLIVPNRYNDLNKLIEKLEPGIFNTYLEQAIESTDNLLIPDIKINSEIRLKSLFPEFGLTGPLQVIEGYYNTKNLHKTHFSFGQYHENIPSELNTIDNISGYVIDKPFIFVVREKFTNAMVFTGKLVIPVNESSQ